RLLGLLGGGIAALEAEAWIAAAPGIRVLEVEEAKLRVLSRPEGRDVARPGRAVENAELAGARSPGSRERGRGEHHRPPHPRHPARGPASVLEVPHSLVVVRDGALSPNRGAPQGRRLPGRPAVAGPPPFDPPDPIL